MGGGIPDPTVNLEADGSDVITSDHVADKICCIASDLLAPGSALDDGTEDSAGDGDGVGVDADTVILTKPYSSISQPPCDTSTEQNAKTLRDFESLVSFIDTS